RGMFPICFNVDTEVLIVPRFGHLVILDQALDLRFGDRGNLALVSVERSEALGGRAFGANGAERADQIRSLIPLLRRLNIFLRKTEAFRELQPQLGMIRRAAFFVDEILE